MIVGERNPDGFPEFWLKHMFDHIHCGSMATSTRALGSFSETLSKSSLTQEQKGDLYQTFAEFLEQDLLPQPETDKCPQELREPMYRAIIGLAKDDIQAWYVACPAEVVKTARRFQVNHIVVTGGPLQAPGFYQTLKENIECELPDIKVIASKVNA